MANEPKPEYFGIFDTVENLWIGNERGPACYTDEDFARVSAQVAEVMLAYPGGRLRARLIPEETWRFHDRQKSKCTPEEALKRLEDGSA